MKVRFLNDRERQDTRAFYESAFPEDSEAFVDFYYDWVVRQNDILVVSQGEGDGYQVQAMVHINCHCLSINGSRESAPYFVAVATRPDCRRQGKMHYLMEKALQDMYRRQHAFAFLMPANPAYYTGLGFRYFPNQSGHAGILGSLPPGMAWRKAGPEDIGRICALANQVLGRKYQISILWDAAYCRRLFAEAAAEGGGVLLLESCSGLQGILAYGISSEGEGGKTAEVKELILQEQLPDCHEEANASLGSIPSCPKEDCQKAMQEAACQAALPGCAIAFPSMELMVRILCIFRFVPLVRSREPKTLWVDVEDPIIPSNCGCFQIDLCPEGGRISRMQRTGRERKIDIAELALILLKDVSVSIHEWV